MPQLLSTPESVKALRILGEKSVWIEAWRSLKRFHKDRRARKHLVFLALGLLLVLALVLGALVYLGFMIGTGAIFMLPLMLPVLWWFRRGARRGSTPPGIAPQLTALDRQSKQAGERALRAWFADLALLYAVVLDRAESERFLKEKELPANLHVTARRMHLDLLKSLNLWQRICAMDRYVLLLPDGHWDLDRINMATTAFEPLRLLRWILRLDFRLPAIRQNLHGTFSIAHELVLNPQRLLRSDRLIDIETMRVSCEEARTTFLRCIAEAISRGYHIPDDQSTIDWANDLAKSLAGNQHEDLLLENNLVSEASQNQLTWAIALARIRHDFLSRALEILEDGNPPDLPLATIFAEESSEESTDDLEHEKIS